jgi:CRISPR system Cascade subunit CasD
MLTGMIGNALGWHWSDSAAHQSIQDRLIFAARIDREGAGLTDTQNALLAKDDKGWTTRGAPEGRDGASYGAPHRRLRDYHADSSVNIALRLEPAAERPALDSLADAFDRPARPLFLGRKACLPSRPLLNSEPARWVLGDTAHQALCALPGDGERCRALWPVGEGPETGDDVDRIVDMPDLRNWRTGLHSGSRRVVEGWVAPVAAT